MRYFSLLLGSIMSIIMVIACGEETVEPPSDLLQILSVTIGQAALSNTETVNVQRNETLTISFTKAVDTETISAITTTNIENNTPQNFTLSTLDNDRIVQIEFNMPLAEGETYQLDIPNTIAAADGSEFSGLAYSFKIIKEDLELIEAFVNGITISTNNINNNIPFDPNITLQFSHDLTTENLTNNVFITGSKNYGFTVEKLESGTFRLQLTEPLEEFARITLLLSSAIGTEAERSFTTRVFRLYTPSDGIPDFPIISDEELLTLVQSQTFKYFYDFAHPNCGLARERNTSGNTVTSGGSGFGMMALIVGVERGFITREQAVERWELNCNFLESADRFHGAWAHWMDGNTGAVRPFSTRDDGGDIVETAFLIQGMLTVRQYLDESDPRESDLIDQITRLWEGVEWDWYTQGGQKRITWHWSPNFGFDINLAVSGHNETQIIYILAAASPTHPVDLETYTNGYARNGNMQNGNTFYSIELPLGSSLGGPLFFTHYSYLGLDPRNLSDQYANYWQQNIAHTRINRAFCIDNPNNFVGYSSSCWGLTASDGDSGYSAHSPTNDRGVITPTAAISSIPFTPAESMEAIRHFYYDLGHKLWGEYGFYDAFNPTEGWVASSYLAIDQGPIVCMIENHRTALLWNLFMMDPEVKAGLEKLEFTY